MIDRKLQNFVVCEGKRFRVQLSFDRVLRFYQLQSDESVDPMDKIDIGFELLVRGTSRRSRQLKVQVLRKMFEELIAVKSKKQKASTKAVDFVQDASYIFSSFWLDYGIDLQEQIGVLDWRKFLSLFNGLSERTKIKEVMSIRTRPLPTPTKYNSAEIRNLLELKAYYALELSASEQEDQFQQGLNRLANALSAEAKRG